MFEFLRKGATSLWAKVFLAIIIIVFVFWGIGSFSSSDKEVVAQINGDKIGLREFQEYYHFKLIQLKQALGEISDEELKKMKFKEMVLEELLQNKIIQQLAKNYGLKVTETEAQLALSQMPFFQEGGVFNQARYQAFLRELNLSSKSFENLLRTDLLKQKLFTYLTTPLLVSQEELEDFYRFHNQRITYQEFILPLELCRRAISFSLQDLENYFQTHRDRYVEDEKIKLAYYFLPFKGEVQLTEEELKNYYQQNLARFKEPQKIKLRRIFIPGTDPQSAQKASEIRSKLKDIKDFETFKAAKAEWFEVDNLPEELKGLIQKAKKGDIFGPVPGKEGYYIYGLEDLQPERFLKYEEVRNRLSEELTLLKIKEKVRQRANELYTKVVSENGLINWAQKNQIKLEETSFLTKEEVAKMFMSRDLSQRIFKQGKGDYFAPWETERGIYLVQIVEKTPKRNLTFEEAKPLVEADFIKEKEKAICEERVQRFIQKAKGIQDLRPLAKELGFRIEERISLRKDLPEMIYFRGAPGIVERPLWSEREVRIVQIGKIEPPSEPLSEKDASLYRQMLLGLKEQNFWEKTITSYRKKAKIKVYPLFHQL